MTIALRMDCFLPSFYVNYWKAIIIIIQRRNCCVSTNHVLKPFFPSAKLMWILKRVIFFWWTWTPFDYGEIVVFFLLLQKNSNRYEKQKLIIIEREKKIEWLSKKLRLILEFIARCHFFFHWISVFSEREKEREKEIEEKNEEKEK